MKSIQTIKRNLHDADEIDNEWAISEPAEAGDITGSWIEIVRKMTSFSSYFASWDSLNDDRSAKTFNYRNEFNCLCL